MLSVWSEKQIKNVTYPDIYLGNTQVNYVDSYEYLGFIFYAYLNFEKQLSRTMQTVHAKSTILYKIRGFINPSTALQLYKSLVLPKLEYGDLFVSSCSFKSVEKLRKIQNRMLRLALRPEMSR